MYSVTATRTFQHVRVRARHPRPWLRSTDAPSTQAQKLLAHIHKMKSASVPVVLVGNKKDMDDQREVPTAEATAFATGAGIPFLGALGGGCGGW